MNAPHPVMLSTAQEAPGDIVQSRWIGPWGLAGQLAVKMLLTASGLALGGILGLIIGVLSGLIPFSC